jgi:hypothetical protein
MTVIITIEPTHSSDLPCILQEYLTQKIIYSLN